jgi:hypothetical protein
MTRSGRFVWFVPFGLLFCLTSPAQSDLRLHYSTLFNPHTVETIQGEVVKVERFVAGNGRDYGVRAILKTGREKVAVILGPVKYLESRGYKIAPNHRVAVTGSRIAVQGLPTFIASEIQGDVHMALRDASGRPGWANGADWHVPKTAPR